MNCPPLLGWCAVPEVTVGSFSASVDNFVWISTRRCGSPKEYVRAQVYPMLPVTHGRVRKLQVLIYSQCCSSLTPFLIKMSDCFIWLEYC